MKAKCGITVVFFFMMLTDKIGNALMYAQETSVEKGSAAPAPLASVVPAATLTTEVNQEKSKDERRRRIKETLNSVEGWFRKDGLAHQQELDQLKHMNALFASKVVDLSRRLKEKEESMRTCEEAFKEASRIRHTLEADKATLIREIEACLQSQVALQKEKAESMRLKQSGEKEYASAQAEIYAFKKELATCRKAYKQVTTEEQVHYKDFQKRFRSTLQLRKELADTYAQLGVAYTYTKHFDLAIDVYNKSLEFEPRNPKLHYYLGLLYKQQNNNAQRAIYHLQKYLQLAPDAKDKAEIEYLIKIIQ